MRKLTAVVSPELRRVLTAAVFRADSIRMQSGQSIRCSVIKECNLSISMEGCSFWVEIALPAISVDQVAT